jgi:hypothetical protein
MTLHLASIPATAGPVIGTRVKHCPPARNSSVKMTATMLLRDSTPLGESFHRWLASKPATKRKAAEYLRLINAK